MPITEIDTLLLKLVSGVELFREMDVDSVSALLRQASSMNFVPGDLVFEEGSEGHAMYIVTQGAFEVFRTSAGKHVRIAKVEAGQHFGEIALVANRTRSASVRALVPSAAIRLSKSVVLAEQKAAVQLFRNMAQMLAKCLISLDEEVILHKTAAAAAEAEAADDAGEPPRPRTYSVVRRGY
jgi:CRP-like cAMP-binding protein